MKLPLHIQPDDMSPEACRARLVLHAVMAQINPKGWRKPHTSRRRRKLPQPFTRLDNLAILARLSGKAAVAEGAKR